MVDVLAQSGRCGRAPSRARSVNRPSREGLAEGDVGELCLGDGGLPTQALQAEAPLPDRRPDAFLQEPVDRGVDAADEEARHRGDAIDPHAGLETMRESPEVRVHHLAVAAQREDQRHVHVDARGDALLDGRDALGSAGIFTMRFGRFTARHSRRASRTVAAVSCASAGATSMLT